MPYMYSTYRNYSTGQHKLYVIYYGVTVPRSDRYRIVLRMQRNVNVQFNKTFSLLMPPFKINGAIN